jgi:hypothetical protein
MIEELEEAICAGDLPRVKLLVQGRASIAGTSVLVPALHQAALFGKTSIVEWLLAEGGSIVSDVTDQGYTALLFAAANLTNHNAETIGWLREHGGADITDTTPDCETVWDFLNRDFRFILDAATGQITALLRVMVLQSAPPADLVVQMSPRYSRVVEEGAQLRAGLPVYLARRRALLAEHTSLIAPLRVLVSSYEEPTTTAELWATGLGALAP